MVIVPPTMPGASGACRGHTASGPPPDALPPWYLGMINPAWCRHVIKLDKTATQHH